MAALSFPVIKNMVYQNVLTMDRYFPGLQSVLEAGMLPIEAVRSIEGD